MRCCSMRSPTFGTEMRVLIGTRSAAPPKVTESALEELPASRVFIQSVHKFRIGTGNAATTLGLQVHLQGSDRVVFKLHDLGRGTRHETY